MQKLGIQDLLEIAEIDNYFKNNNLD